MAEDIKKELEAFFAGANINEVNAETCVAVEIEQIKKALKSILKQKYPSLIQGGDTVIIWFPHDFDSQLYIVTRNTCFDIILFPKDLKKFFDEDCGAGKL